MCVIVNLIYRNEFGFESQILLKHIKYIKLCVLTINRLVLITDIIKDDASAYILYVLEKR
jgi:hypothetical protein